MENNIPGSPVRRDLDGVAEVHSEVVITSAGTGAPRTGGSTMGAADRAAGAAENAVDQAKDKAHELADRAQDKAGDLADQAKQKAGEAKQKASEALDQAERKLEESGVLDKIRDNPLAALGVAVGIGFLLAGDGDDGDKGQSRKKGGMASKAKHQLKGAVMGGLSAAMAQEFRSFLGQGGSAGGLFSSLMGGDDAEQSHSGTGSSASGRSTAGRSTGGSAY